jgi:hypothetical protein
MTKSDPYHNEYACPNCEADVSVALPVAKYATCDECKTKLEIHPDADFEDGMWHDRTTLSIVDPEREHKERMVKYGKRYQELLQAAVCEHKYAEQTCAPLGVRCIKCGQFIGAHE